MVYSIAPMCWADVPQLTAMPAQCTSGVVCTTTNHESHETCMNDQFIFNQENEAINSDKPIDDTISIRRS